MRIQDRSGFKTYILTNLGEPLIKVNVAPEQMDYKIDEALQYFQEYHHDATEEIIIQHEVTADDLTNRYIPTLENVIGVKEVWYSIGGTNGWHGSYSRDLWEKATNSGTGLSSYISAEQNIAEFESLLTSKINWQYNKNSDKLRLEVDWDNVTLGEFVTYRSIRVIDPDTNDDIWNDMWLKPYATELVKKQWGQNLIKFSNVELPGGMSLDGESMISSADEALQLMREEMLSKYSFGADIYLG